MSDTLSILLIDAPDQFGERLDSDAREVHKFKLFGQGTDNRQGNLYGYDAIVFAPTRIDPTRLSTSLLRSYARCDWARAISKAVEAGSVVIVFVQPVKRIGDRRQNLERIEKRMYTSFCSEFYFRSLSVPDSMSTYDLQNKDLGDLFTTLSKMEHKPIRATVEPASPSSRTVIPMSKNRAGECHSLILRFGQGAIVVLPGSASNVEVVEHILVFLDKIKQIPLNKEDGDQEQFSSSESNYTESSASSTTQKTISQEKPLSPKPKRKSKSTSQHNSMLLQALLLRHHKFGDDEFNFNPAKQGDIAEELGWSQPKVSRTMKAILGEDPIQKYKRMCKSQQITGFLKKLYDGPTVPEPIDDEHIPGQFDE